MGVVGGGGDRAVWGKGEVGKAVAMTVVIDSPLAASGTRPQDCFWTRGQGLCDCDVTKLG